MIAAVLACVLAAAPEADNRVRLVVGYDTGARSRAMFPVLAKVRESGHDVVFVNLDKPAAAAPFLTTFGKTPDEAPPFFLAYIGHEAFEKASGVTDPQTLADWLDALRAGRRSPAYERPTQQRDYLQDAPENKVYLRRRLSAPSCGMLWCVSHRTEILEYVDAAGNVVGRPQP